VLGGGSSPETATDAAALRRPELNVDWQLVAASSDVVGVRLRTGRYLGTDWGRSGSILWYDRARSAVTGSAGLLAGQAALYEVAQLVRDGLRGRVGVDPGELSADPGELDSMAFNRNGDLVVEFDDCQIGSCALGRLGVAVPAEQVEALLSKTGRRAQRSARAASRTSPTGPGTQPGAPGPVTGAPWAPAARERALDCRKAKCVALTFDDGPGPDTPRLLDMLRRADARATFFTVGANAAAAPSVLRRMSAEGHVIGNHSWAHRNLSRLSTSRIADSLGRTQDLISSVVGSAPTLARAPYGAVSPDVAKITRELGLTLVDWDVDAQIAPGDAAAGAGGAGGRYADAKMDPNVTTARRGHAKAGSKTGAEAVRSEVARRAVEDARPGAIILLHDTSAAAVDAVPAIIEGLRAKGYVFATVQELHGAGAPETGEAQVEAQETAEGAIRRPAKGPDPAAAG
jgi:peptidoglycan/xylan/chitin deacetylase (PgdA/CDA1 family)